MISSHTSALAHLRSEAMSVSALVILFGTEVRFLHFCTVNVTGKMLGRHAGVNLLMKPQGTGTTIDFRGFKMEI